MAYCVNCGAPVEGQFCAQCGTPVDAGAPRVEAPVYPTAGRIPENIASALCYVLGLVTGILFLVLPGYNRNKTVRFHAFQSIFLHICWLIVTFVVEPLLFRIMDFFAGPFGSLISLAFFILYLYLIISAYQGKKVVLPVIGPLAQQQA